MNDTLILFGRSMFINKIKKHIPDLIKKYDSLGINTFYESYPNINAVIFYDKTAAPTRQIDNLIITDRKNADTVIHQKNKELYEVVTNREEFSIKQGVINFYYFTSSMAINWAYLKGYKNVVLCGIDLMNNLHFDNDFKSDLSDGVQAETKKYMENICTKYINLFQLNPESDLKIPKINIDNLLKGEIHESYGKNQGFL
jgi:S-adenosylhomocysteine hydrolase